MRVGPLSETANKIFTFRSEWNTLIGPDLPRHCAMIGLRHKDTAQGTQSIAFAVSLWHAGKGSIIEAGVNNIMIQLIIDSLCACPPLRVS